MKTSVFVKNLFPLFLFAAILLLNGCTKDVPNPMLSKEDLLGTWFIVEEILSDCSDTDSDTSESFAPVCQDFKCYQFIFREDDHAEFIYRRSPWSLSEIVGPWSVTGPSSIEFCSFLQGCFPIEVELQGDQLALIFEPGFDITSIGPLDYSGCVRTLHLTRE